MKFSIADFGEGLYIESRTVLKKLFDFNEYSSMKKLVNGRVLEYSLLSLIIIRYMYVCIKCHQNKTLIMLQHFPVITRQTMKGIHLCTLRRTTS